MPYPTFPRRHLRSIAAWTLSAWVLAMMAGLTNACRLRSYVPAAPVPVVAAHADAGSHCLHGKQLPTADEGRSSSGVSACLKFCDESSSTVGKGAAAPPDLAGLVMLGGAVWSAMPPAATASRRRSAGPPASRGPPLFLRLLRLTI